jgi:hypothetical protein
VVSWFSRRASILLQPAWIASLAGVGTLLLRRRDLS